MCVACVDLGWAPMGRIFKDWGSKPPPNHLLFCFCNFFHFVYLCPNSEQPRLPIDHYKMKMITIFLTFPSI
jgi:hypothetical protein